MSISQHPIPSPDANGHVAGVHVPLPSEIPPAKHKGPLELRRKQADTGMSDQHLLDTSGAGQFIHTDPWRVLRIQSEFVEGFGALADIGPAVSVFGSARTKPGTEYYEMAVDVGRKLAQAGVAVITGGGPGSMEAANKVLDSWSDCAPESGYDQCDFRIVFEDGVRYEGHYKLSKTQKRSSLSRYVRKQLTDLAKAKAKARSTPPPRKVEEDQPVMDLLGVDLAETARIALDHYNI